MTVLRKDKITKHLGIKMDKDDYEMLKNEAKRQHMSLATWVRKTLLDLLKVRAFNED